MLARVAQLPAMRSMALKTAQYPLTSRRELSSGTQSNLLAKKSHLTQLDREVVFEIGMVSGLIGAYHLMQERSTNMAHKPHYEQPYECGFNQMGGVIFAGFTFVIWVFLLFELEIIMLMLTPNFDVNLPFFLVFLTTCWFWVWLYPQTTNF
ncbi:unnamed protein product [Oikopleura dioica]|uniref:NADH dehydrogenase subunit 3 n=1 Tax=Oikopleura dioica TaxID=34765 RepID=E4XTD4_OIKDI|nr:unnamed protein product [Oikopleura dioica]